MSLEKLFSLFRKRPTYLEVRQSYGAEPYRKAAEVSTEERAQAIIEGTIKSLLQDIIGYEALKRLPEKSFAEKFCDLLPTTEFDFREYIRVHGLPKQVARYGDPNSFGTWIYKIGDQWHLTCIDIYQVKYDAICQSKHEAETKAINRFLSTIKWYISGSKDFS